MLAIAFRFPAGRYHATPWGRHVNEAEVEWPPSPWRILRALVATYHRKGWADRYPETVLDGLLEALADTLPSYALPPAIQAHSRHYMPQGRLSGGRETTSLVFDAFARVDPERKLVACWPALTLQLDQRDLLDDLLRDLGFLGRAESWRYLRSDSAMKPRFPRARGELGRGSPHRAVDRRAQLPCLGARHRPGYRACPGSGTPHRTGHTRRVPTVARTRDLCAWTG